jgi:hypothetical protein
MGERALRNCEELRGEIVELGKTALELALASPGTGFGRQFMLMITQNIDPQATAPAVDDRSKGDELARNLMDLIDTACVEGDDEDRSKMSTTLWMMVSTMFSARLCTTTVERAVRLSVDEFVKASRLAFAGRLSS